jgi:hypothetical protein
METNLVVQKDITVTGNELFQSVISEIRQIVSQAVSMSNILNQLG